MFRRWWPSSSLTTSASANIHSAAATKNNENESSRDRHLMVIAENNNIHGDCKAVNKQDQGTTTNGNDGVQQVPPGATDKETYTAADVPDFRVELDLDDDGDMF